MTQAQTDFSLSETAAIFEVSRGTVDRWLASGCPAKRRADRTRRMAWVLHIPDVIKWHRQQALAKAAAGMTGDRGMTKVFKARRLAAECSLAEIRAAEELRRVVDVEYAEKGVAALLNRIRAALLPLGGDLADRIATMRSATDIKTLIDAEIRAALRRVASKDACDGR